MTRREQKTHEYQIVERYLAKRGVAGMLKNSPEPPDMVLDSDGKLIGIEVTTYHVQDRTRAGHTRRQVEAAWEAVRSCVVEYREVDHSLDNLSVHLFFKTLACPQKREIIPFVKAIAAEINKHAAKLSRRTYKIVIDTESSDILQKYLREIYVREVNCYIEWDWNHSAGGVGTTDQELLNVVKPKLNYQPPPEFHQNWLIISGGSMISEIIGIWYEFQLPGLTQFNKALSNGPYDEVALYCIKSFLWVRNKGWSQI